MLLCAPLESSMKLWLGVTVGRVLTALKLGKRFTAAAVSRGNGRNGLMSSDGCKGGAGGRTRAGRAGLWHVPPTRAKRQKAFSRERD